MKPVALPSGRAKLSTKPAPTGSGTMNEHDRHSAGRLLQRPTGPTAPKDHVGDKRDQFGRVPAHVAALPPLQRVSTRRLRPIVHPERCNPCRNAAKRAFLPVRRRGRHQHADAPHPLRLLRARRERPRERRAAEKRDDLAAPDHSITSSARASRDGGTSRPSALAVLRLITSSYLVGACTGRSAGFSPLRMRST